MNEDMNNIPQWNEENKNSITDLAGKVKSLPVKVLAIGAAAVLALILIIVLIARGGSSSGSVDLGVSTGGPLGLVTTGLENSLTALNENPMVELADGVMNGGSVEVSVDLETITDMLPFPMSLDGTASVKVYSDLEKMKGAVEVKTEVGGATVDAGAYASEKAIAIASEALLGKDAYGIGLKDIVKNFENSEFGPDGEFSLGIDLPDETQIDQKQVKKIAKSTESLAKDVAKQTLKSVKANAEISKGKDTLTFGDKTAKVTTVTVEMDAEQIGAFATEMLQYVAKDKDIKKYLENNLEILAEAADADSEQVEMVIENFYESIGEAEDQVEDLVEQMEEMDISFKAVFYITKSGKQLVGMDVILGVNDEETKVSVTAGPDWAELSEISVAVESADSESGVNYTVEKNDKKEYSAKLTVTMNDEEVGEGKIHWDKKAGDFKVEIDDGVYLNGTMKKSGKKVEIFLKEIGSNDEEIELNTTVTLSTSDKTPSVPKYKDVLTMNSDELEGIVEDIRGAAEDLMDLAA